MNIIEYFRKNYILTILIIIIVILLFYKRKVYKDNEKKTIIEFEKLNALSSSSKKDKDLEDEKQSLINLIKNSNEVEREILHDLINGTITVFSISYKGKEKEDAIKNFNEELNKFYGKLIEKHGKDAIASFKVKMDKFGFDI